MFGKKDAKPDTRTEKQKEADLQKAVTEADKLTSGKEASPKKIQKKLASIKSTYRLTSLELVNAGGIKFHIEGVINPKNKAPDHELVASIEELVANAPPEAKAGLIAAVNAAQDAQKKSMEVYTIITGGAPQPIEAHEPKTAAVAVPDTGPPVITVSGWGSLTKWQKREVAAKMGVPPEQNEPLVKAYFEAHKDEFKALGYGPLGHFGDPTGPTKKTPTQGPEPGKHHLSHAEKQAEAISGAKAIGVSRAVCRKDCYPYFFALAKIKGTTFTIADPDGTYIFYPGGPIKFLPHAKK